MILHRLGHGHEEPKALSPGVREEVLTRLPTVKYPRKPPQDGQTNCAVCLCDFEGGERLRMLPCGHIFHSPCVDTWLRRNKVCPLCLYDAELPPPRSRLWQ